ncbi:N-acetylneuraminate synthase family protein [Methylobacillus gramineus]|uniref:N-acetylneuraminate synthase family protein n=1 Tax=Methylobacillus gramineus TaxID=755169 RepID=UPI001CFFBE6B|nr:N-acetylneuraminate synthase family protein [Methylobacillus gramineus]MCB5184113.1 N-acetylneuraminate synthase family protein [Methylobacillus gramineus]
MASFEIAGRKIGDGYEPIVIAEIGINHEGSLDVAIDMARAAIEAGAEIIKHQTHVVEDEMSDEAKGVIPGNADVSIYEIMRRCSLSEDDEYKLMQYVQQQGSIFISTPFSRMAANRLKKFDIPAYKIGSGECNNYPLVRHIASFGKPIIVSTGMNSIETIAPTVNILRQAKVPFALLHCTNIYPTPPELVRLDAIQVIKNAYPDAVVGLSDHTVGNYACLGAVALGGSILERHFTDTMSRPGPDIVCSMDPAALQDLITGSKVIFAAKGAYKGPLLEEEKTIAFAFASVVAIKDINVGDVLSEDNIWLRRPGGGDFNASDYDQLLGRKALQTILSGKRVNRQDVEA